MDKPKMVMSNAVCLLKQRHMADKKIICHPPEWAEKKVQRVQSASVQLIS